MPGKTVYLRAMNLFVAPASMRPQRNAGENSAGFGSPALKSQRFNEAPAKCRGKHISRRFSSREAARFNEAPAKCRGKRWSGNRNRHPAAASMRPQRNAGENFRTFSGR